jgi:hypothetical protein
MQTNMILVDNYSSYYRTCLNDRTDTDQKVSLENCKRIAGKIKIAHQHRNMYGIFLPVFCMLLCVAETE